MPFGSEIITEIPDEQTEIFGSLGGKKIIPSDGGSCV